MLIKIVYFNFQELLNTAIVTIFYTIAFIVQLSVWSPYPYNVYYKGPNIAAGVSI